MKIYKFLVLLGVAFFATPFAFGANSCFSVDTSVVQDPHYFDSLTDSFKALTGGVYNIGIEPEACECFPGYKKTKKRVYSGPGGAGTLERITICEKCDPDLCNCGIKLNTFIPFVGSCIMLDSHDIPSDGESTTVTATTAFPVLMGSLMRMLIGVILVVGFGMIVVGGFQMTVPGQYDKGKKLIFNVIYAVVGLGLLGAILYLINPNFFV